MQNHLRFSRPVAAAAELGESAPDCHRFTSKRVLLTGNQESLTTANGRVCLLSSLRLLIRICHNLSIVLPAGADGILNECRRVAVQLAGSGAVQFPNGAPDFRQYDAVLSIGTLARSDLPWTVINSNGWLARVSSSSQSLPVASEMTNPIGALLAACLGVTEVFKRLIRLKESRGRLLDGLTFSLHSYRCGEDDPGPPLPAEVPLDLLLVGAALLEMALFISSPSC